MGVPGLRKENMEPKSWYLSRTILTNLIIGAISTIVGAFQIITGDTIPVDPGVQGAIVSGILVIANLILRRITGQPIA